MDSIEMSDTREEIRKYIDEKVLFRCHPEKHYAFGKGKIPSKNVNSIKQNTAQYFMRRLTHNVKMMSHVTTMMDGWIQDALGSDGRIQLCGLETGSLPLMTALQWHILYEHGLEINAFSVRKERKPYGLFNYIEGIPNDFPLVFVDDMINSGDSVTAAMDIVDKELGLADIKDIWCILAGQEFDDVKSLLYTNEFDVSLKDDSQYWEPADVV